MSIISKLVKKELINLNNSSENQQVFFDSASDVLFKKGYVTETFKKAIEKREKIYPTGLQLEHIAVAIPHTDVEHIVEPFIYINKVYSEQLEFIQMGTDDVVMRPNYIIILGIKEPKEQVGLLSTLIEVLSDKVFINKLKASSSEDEVFKMFNSL